MTMPSAIAYDALLVVSFGGPEAPEHVVPFLQNVTRGRGVPEERLRVVGQHYFDRGGISPINDQCRQLVAALEQRLADQAIDVPVYWGNRNWDPMLADTVAQMRDDGVERALAFVTSAYSSYSSCRQYRENIAAAQAAVGPDAPQIDKIRVYFNHPGFIEPLVDNTAASVQQLSQTHRRPHVFFTAHSIPTAMAAASHYQAQLLDAAGLVADRVPGIDDWSFVWQSRSGPPTVPWLEPDICDAIRDLDDSFDSVVIVPVGFISDHMEVIQDLDTDARRAAEARGLGFARARTAGTDGRFVDMIVELWRERAEGTAARWLGTRSPDPTHCSGTCCPAPTRPPATGRRP